MTPQFQPDRHAIALRFMVAMACRSGLASAAASAARYTLSAAVDLAYAHADAFLARYRQHTTAPQAHAPAPSRAAHPFDDEIPF